MKKNIVVFGLIAGIIVSAFMIFSIVMCYRYNDWQGSMVIGYAAMIIAFSFVFVGIKNQRDKFNGGTISFKEAFKTGILITLIASTLYVVAWLVEYYVFVPDFMEKYTEHVIQDDQSKGATAEEIRQKTEELAAQAEMYKNPLVVILFTYLEILPVGIMITLISALILKRKKQPEAALL